MTAGGQRDRTLLGFQRTAEDCEEGQRPQGRGESKKVGGAQQGGTTEPCVPRPASRALTVHTQLAQDLEGQGGRQGGLQKGNCSPGQGTQTLLSLGAGSVLNQL